MKLALQPLVQYGPAFKGPPKKYAVQPADGLTLLCYDDEVLLLQGDNNLLYRTGVYMPVTACTIFKVILPGGRRPGSMHANLAVFTISSGQIRFLVHGKGFGGEVGVQDAHPMSEPIQSLTLTSTLKNEGVGDLVATYADGSLVVWPASQLTSFVQVLVVAKGQEVNPAQMDCRKLKGFVQDSTSDVADSAILGTELRSPLEILINNDAKKARIAMSSTENSSRLGYHVFSAGNKPLFSLTAFDERRSSNVLGNLAKGVTGALSGALTSFWGGTGGIQAQEEEKKEIATQEGKLESGIDEPKREAVFVSVSPSSKYACVTDNHGRLLLVDLEHSIIVRIFKGYRNAKTGWIEVEDDQGNENSFSRLLVVHDVNQNSLDLWAAPFGDRVERIFLKAGSELFYAPQQATIAVETMLGAEGSEALRQLQNVDALHRSFPGCRGIVTIVSDGGQVGIVRASFQAVQAGFSSTSGVDRIRINKIAAMCASKKDSFDVDKICELISELSSPTSLIRCNNICNKPWVSHADLLKIHQKAIETSHSMPLTDVAAARTVLQCRASLIEWYQMLIEASECTTEVPLETLTEPEDTQQIPPATLVAVAVQFGDGERLSVKLPTVIEFLNVFDIFADNESTYPIRVLGDMKVLGCHLLHCMDPELFMAAVKTGIQPVDVAQILLVGCLALTGPKDYLEMRFHWAYSMMTKLMPEVSSQEDDGAFKSLLRATNEGLADGNPAIGHALLVLLQGQVAKPMANMLSGLCISTRLATALYAVTRDTAIAAPLSRVEVHEKLVSYFIGRIDELTVLKDNSDAASTSWAFEIVSSFVDWEAFYAILIKETVDVAEDGKIKTLLAVLEDLMGDKIPGLRTGKYVMVSGCGIFRKCIRPLLSSYADLVHKISKPLGATLLKTRFDASPEDIDRFLALTEQFLVRLLNHKRRAQGDVPDPANFYSDVLAIVQSRDCQCDQDVMHLGILKGIQTRVKALILIKRLKIMCVRFGNLFDEGSRPAFPSALCIEHGVLSVTVQPNANSHLFIKACLLAGADFDEIEWFIRMYDIARENLMGPALVALLVRDPETPVQKLVTRSEQLCGGSKLLEAKGHVANVHNLFVRLKGGSGDDSVLPQPVAALNDEPLPTYNEYLRAISVSSTTPGTEDGSQSIPKAVFERLVEAYGLLQVSEY
eukprot:Clim_evm220s157 gene=Clim_evmTU220s157